MNDYNNNLSQVELLQKEILRLKEENLFLKEEIRRLNLQISGLNSQNSVVNINSPLVDYYLNRYLEIHEYVLNNRISAINEDIDKAQLLYDELASREDMIEVIANKNAVIKEQIEFLENQIEENQSKLDSFKEQFNEEADTVTNKENNIYYTTIDYYNSLLNKLSIGIVEDTKEYMNFVIDVIKYTLYDEVIKYHALAKEALKMYDELNVLEYEIKNQNILLSNQKDELAKGIEVISYEETEKKLDALAYEITNKKNAKSELIELFENLKKENTKNIKDEIKHLQILEYTNQNIALKMDDLILNYRDSLSIADTNSNIVLHKKIELQKLNEKIEYIYSDYKIYESLKEEYNELQSMHQTIVDNISSIENYISQTKKLIDSNVSFKKTIKDYTEAKIKLSSIEASLESVKIREKTLGETRKEILNNPYGKTDLMRVDEELRQVQETVAAFSSECTSLHSKIYQLKETEQDYKIISIYDELLLCEKELPKLYEKQKNLSSIINDKYVELSDAKSKSNEYESLKSQIEALEDEIANLQ